MKHKKDYIWYFNDGSFIFGRKALSYIQQRQNELNDFMKEIDSDIKQMIKFNCNKELISDEKQSHDPEEILLTTLENLSII